MASAAPSSVQQTHPFTCNTCQVAFRSSELQRAHMQTDWHRYNLKRRVASLPPLSSEVFAEKVLANKASAAATAARASYEKTCTACQKMYYSENAFINHLSSQKHKLSVARDQKSGSKTGDDSVSVMSSTFSLGEPVDTASNGVVGEAAEEEFSEIVNGINKTNLEDTDNDPLSRRPSRPHHSRTEEDDRTPHPISETTTDPEETERPTATPSEPVKTCLFCNFASPSFALNIHHMTRYHDLFIPEREYLVDTEGLIGYLHVKITEGHQCLYCGKGKHTTSGIMTHMRDRGHCKIAFDSEEEQLEIGQFYDFSSTYSDPEIVDDSDYSTEQEDSTIKSSGAKLGAKRDVETKIDGDENGDAVMDDEGWETDSTLSSVPTEELTAVPIEDHSHQYAKLHKSRHHSHTDQRPHKNLDGWHSHAHNTPHAVYYDDFELHLPTGRIAGHRSMNKYWRQNLRSHPSVSERAERLAVGDADADGDIDMDAKSPQSQELQRGHDRGRQLATASRANGGLGMVGVTDSKRKEVSKAEKRERGSERRQVERWRAGNERRNNFQKHYRDPLLQ